MKRVRVVRLHLFLYLKLKKTTTASLDCTCELTSVNSKLAKFQRSTYKFDLQFHSRSVSNLVVYSLFTNICQITILSFQYNFLLVDFTLSENVADHWRKDWALYEKKRLWRLRDRSRALLRPLIIIKRFYIFNYMSIPSFW